MASYQTRIIALIIFLLFFIGLSVGQVLDVAEDMNQANLLPSEAIAEAKKIRKLVDIVASLDYNGDCNGKPNQKHEPPPKNGKCGKR